MVEIAYWQIVLTALPLLAFIVNLSFGVFIFKRKRILVNRLFTLLMLSFCWWTIGDFAMRLARTKAAATLMLKFINIAIPCIPAIALAFVLALENKVSSKRQLALMVIGSLIFIALNIAGFLVTKPPEVRNDFGVYMIPDMPISIYNGYVYFTVYMIAFTSYVLYRLLRFYRTCDNEMVKKRIRYMLIGAFITTAVTFITEFLIPFLIPLGILPVGFDIPSLGSFSTIFITSLTYYSVRSR
jgi:hypothetical protein